MRWKCQNRGDSHVCNSVTWQVIGRTLHPQLIFSFFHLPCAGFTGTSTVSSTALIKQCLHKLKSVQINLWHKALTEGTPSCRWRRLENSDWLTKSCYLMVLLEGELDAKDIIFVKIGLIEALLPLSAHYIIFRIRVNSQLSSQFGDNRGK